MMLWNNRILDPRGKGCLYKMWWLCRHLHSQIHELFLLMLFLLCCEHLESIKWDSFPISKPVQVIIPFVCLCHFAQRRGENVFFSAKLRNPHNTPEALLEEVVEDVLNVTCPIRLFGRWKRCCISITKIKETNVIRLEQEKWCRLPCKTLKSGGLVGGFPFFLRIHF